MQSPSVDHVPEHATLGVHTYLPTSGMSVRRYVPDCREVWEGNKRRVCCALHPEIFFCRGVRFMRDMLNAKELGLCYVLSV